MAVQNTQSVDGDALALADSISGLLRAGGTLGEACWETTADENEALYAMGHGMYEQGRYREAFKVFSLLVIQNHREPRYLFGLGGACQMLGRYRDALQHYMAVAVARPDDPLPILHAAQCLIALSHVTEARESLELVLEMCPDQHSALYTRAQVLLQDLHSAKGDNDEHH